MNHESFELVLDYIGICHLLLFMFLCASVSCLHLTTATHLIDLALQNESIGT